MATGRATRSRTLAGGTKAATLHEIAAAAGCSTATVSKALNGLTVSPEYLNRVLAAADELGYIPNLAARSMRNEKTMTIGMAVNFEGHPRSELMGVFQSMINHMESSGYSVLMSIVRGDGVDVDALLRRFLAHRVDGLFFWNAQPARSLPWYKKANIPVIAVGFRSPECTDIPLVTIDGAGAYGDAIQSLKALDHHAVAEIAVDGAIFTHRVFVPPRRIRWHDLRIGHSRQELSDLLETKFGVANGPTAVFAAPPTAMQILSLAEELGIRIPQDLSVVSLSDPEEAALYRTPLSSIRSDYERMGRRAAMAMVDALEGKQVQDVIVADSAFYIERASTGPARSN